MYDVAIIGCGIVGANAAWELSKYELTIAILEKENDVACGTTKANSAVVHAGYDPRPGTKMARLNVLGSEMMEGLCGRLGVEYERIGSLVIAFNKKDTDKLQEILARGQANGVKGLKILGKKETLEIEPGLNPEVLGALFTPTAAIINPWGLCISLAENAVINGTKLHLNTEVKGIVRKDSYYLIETTRGDFEARYIVNAAGAYSDKVSEMVVEPFFKITPVKGEYFLMDKSQGKAVRHVVFQTPNELGKGVLIAPTVHGNLIVGPNTEIITHLDDTAVTSLGLEKVLNVSRLSCERIDFSESIRNFAGIRATAGETDDFIIEASKSDFINAAAIKSPGLSSAPAIALEIIKLLSENGLKLQTKKRFEEFRRPALFKDMGENEKNEALRKDKRYGRVICRCETITEGDILASLKSPIPPVSLDGVKRRLRPGSGRCQGGFCGPRVHELLSRELGIKMEEVCQDLAGSFLLSGETKREA